MDALGVVGLGMAAAALAPVRTRAVTVNRVAPELRHPMLLWPTPAYEWTLLALRAVPTAPQVIPQAVKTSEHRVPGPPDAERVHVTVYQPAAGPTENRPALLWIHGGGMVSGSRKQDAAWCGRLADELDAVVVATDYRLAPEHPFPAGPHDCLAAWMWLATHAEMLGVDPARIAIGGASAGGLMAATVTQLLLDVDGPMPCFQLLVQPALDDRTVVREHRIGTGDFVWTHTMHRMAWTAYLGARPSAASAPPYAAPSRRADLAGLPPAWIGVGDVDLLIDENTDYAQRLSAAGVPAELVVVPGAYHAFESVTWAPQARAFREAQVAALRAAFATD